MQKLFILLIYTIFITAVGSAQTVNVSPDSVTAYSQGATTAYLTFSNVVDLRPAEADWCGAIIPAAPDLGFKCDPATFFGRLPARYDQSRQIGTRYTDLMSITPAVARRAYTDAVNGNDSRFFFVKHFISTNGGPDQFVPVTIRLSGNGAGVPFSLTSVKLNWQDGQKVVPFIRPDERLPKITAEIRYTGTGRLKGRWELVRPGEELPSTRDLLSEASLPPEERGTQRRYTLLSRFNVNLPPGGKYQLPGPENWRIDKSVEGVYLLLFRVEVSDAPNSVSDTGNGRIATGGAAGFPMPFLKYYVGNSSNGGMTQITNLPNVKPESDASTAPIILRWDTIENAKLYRLRIVDDEDKTVFSAIIQPPAKIYQLPPFIRQMALSKPLKWQLAAIGENGQILQETKLTDVDN